MQESSKSKKPSRKNYTIYLASETKVKQTFVQFSLGIFKRLYKYLIGKFMIWYMISLEYLAEGTLEGALQLLDFRDPMKNGI